MWGGRGLRAARGRALGLAGVRRVGRKAEPPRATGLEGKQTNRTLPWLFSNNGIMYLKSNNITVAYSNKMRNLRHVGTRFRSTSTTVDPKEMKIFQALAFKWWDEQGVYAPLHSMNDLRVPFIRDNLLKMVAGHQLESPLSGMKILDVGCGGGLLSEPLGRLGALVTGIDPLNENIKIAQQHKSFDPILDKRIQYKACILEDIVEETAESFDAVVASEVVEHVNDLETFIQCCCKVLKPGGSLFITTINKTQLSYALAIIFAEQISGIVPKGTHTWEKFVSPEELESFLESNGLLVQTIIGMLYNPFSGYWRWTENTSINYAAHAVKSNAQVETEEHHAKAPGVHSQGASQR
ncbi:ubiquinone biosynthesis O-methyltransferase, mitochondrial [Gracilinanus agilis]|uniref:ubiquinone biosynthesis O-methyltransferase, mitochondrial n=1 Tax=Gracilinanus agilis TaxID=191870 RepID=UPI001CFE8BE4|nr:ubiquinone biosynthesis O-methyltransferase, mitochondrial [Gracilinanus agilis]